MHIFSYRNIREASEIVGARATIGLRGAYSNHICQSWWVVYDVAQL